MVRLYSILSASLLRTGRPSVTLLQAARRRSALLSLSLCLPRQPPPPPQLHYSESDAIGGPPASNSVLPPCWSGAPFFPLLYADPTPCCAKELKRGGGTGKEARKGGRRAMAVGRRGPAEAAVDRMGWECSGMMRRKEQEGKGTVSFRSRLGCGPCSVRLRRFSPILLPPPLASA